MLKLQLLGVPVEIRLDFWIVTVLLAFTRLGQPLLLAEWIAVVAVSILVHEMGHAVAFRVFGHQPRVVLYSMGGLTYGTPGVPMSPGRDVLVSLAGPAAGLVFGGLVVLLSTVWPPPRESLLIVTAIEDLKWVNIGWGLVNLLPIVPLDGGQVLAATLRLKMPRHEADRIAAIVAVAVGAGAAVVAYSLGMTYAAVLAALLAAQAFSTARGTSSS